MVEIQNTNITELINKIERGTIKIPQFQRDFIWSKKKSASLIDSIIKGYPIGTFIIWKTKEHLRTVKNIGDLILKPVPKGDFTNYVLDGQQRLTSIFATIKGKKIKRKNNIDNFSEIFIDLDAKKSKLVVVTSREKGYENSYIQLNVLLYGGLTKLTRFPEKYHHKIEKYKSAIKNYPIPLLVIEDEPIDVATEIFTRINVGGKPLTIFEVMVAKTFDANSNFDLAEKYDSFIKKISKIGYGRFSDAVLLRSISVILTRECGKKDILTINKSDFIDIFPYALKSIERAVDYFRLQIKIPVIELLPYQDLIVLFSFYFYNHNDTPPQNHQKLLIDLFWRISLTNRYTSATDGKIAQDIRRIRKIIRNEIPEYDFSPLPYITKEYIERYGKFNKSNSYSKAILCLLAEKRPLSLYDNSEIDLTGKALTKSNSKNYHHFFPKSFLKKKNIDSTMINHLANIIFLDDMTNKKIIGSQPPADYIKKLGELNTDLRTTLKTHLIEILKDGIFENDYTTFFNHRITRFSEELKRKIVWTKTDTIVEPNEESDDLVYVEYKNITAKGRRQDKGILVFSNSFAVVEMSDSIQPHLLKLFISLIENHILELDIDRYRFSKSYYFNSLSTAASIICGSSRNGRITWKYKNGKTIKEYEELGN